jgi:outer membrane protein, heavy metal efflux system
MNNMGKYFAAVLVMLIIFQAAFAQSEKLTVAEALNSAYNRNAELQQLYAQLEQMRQLWRTETGISSPGISYFKEGIGSGPGDLFDEKRITVSQELDFPLSSAYRLKGIAERVKSKEYQIRLKEKEIKAEVKSNYVEVLYALYLQRSNKNRLQLAQDVYHAVFTKFSTGMANGIDLVNAELQLDEAKNDDDLSEWTLHKARYSLFNVIGLPIDEQKYTIQFSDTLLAPDIEISEIFALAVQEIQPDYQSATHELKAADYFLKEARSNILPDIRLNLYRQNYGAGYNFTGFEVGLSFPLWYPLEVSGKINSAKASRQEILWKQNEIKLNTKKNIELAWHNYDVSRKIVKRYHDNMKSRAARLRDMSLKAYQLGEIDLLNLLTAQHTFLNSEQRYLTALRDYYLQLVVLEKYLENDLVKE